MRLYTVNPKRNLCPSALTGLHLPYYCRKGALGTAMRHICRGAVSGSPISPGSHPLHQGMGRRASPPTLQVCISLQSSSRSTHVSVTGGARL